MRAEVNKTNVFACFLVGIIADFSDQKGDGGCYYFSLIFTIFMNLGTQNMDS